jgi:ferritin-like metal-binding protein YciE
MISEKSKVLEEAPYVALNTLEETASMSRALANWAREQRQHSAEERFEERVRKTGEQVELIRQVLNDGAPAATEEAL